MRWQCDFESLRDEVTYLGTTITMNNGGGIEVLDGEGLKERCAER
jgi:hypothetical protein